MTAWMNAQIVGDDDGRYVLPVKTNQEMGRGSEGARLDEKLFALMVLDDRTGVKPCNVCDRFECLVNRVWLLRRDVVRDLTREQVLP